MYLAVLGLGMGDVKDSTMEKLADRGKGNYAYLDSLEEADKVLVRQLDGTLVTVAKDVKSQIEFNPASVGGYRLIGYKDRLMSRADFKDDSKTAGEMGAGHSATALYELIPASAALGTEPPLEPLKYQPVSAPTIDPVQRELMTVHVRYQPTQGGESQKIEVPVPDTARPISDISTDFRFSSAVAAFGMVLRESPYRGEARFDRVIEMADHARGEDIGGFRKQFVELVTRAKGIENR